VKESCQCLCAFFRATSPEVILYDEPTTGLDTITSREISELILDIKRKITPLQLLSTWPVQSFTADRIMILRTE
jgi:phospholipid/cholesterol/gamma-HCH transport system ATP-binding protein